MNLNSLSFTLAPQLRLTLPHDRVLPKPSAADKLVRTRMALGPNAMAPPGLVVEEVVLAVAPTDCAGIVGAPAKYPSLMGLGRCPSAPPSPAHLPCLPFLQCPLLSSLLLFKL